MTPRHLWLTLPFLAACAINEAPIAEATQDIHGDLAAPASQFQLDRAVKLPSCTATKISARYALTASHCGSSTNQQVRFYTTGPGVNSLSLADIVNVHVRPGVNPSTCEHTDSDGCIDSNGDFADIAVLELAEPDTGTLGDESDLEGHQATLAWVFPGYGYDGVKVGAGAHNGNDNETGVLLQYPDETTSDDDNDGHFDTRDETVNGGDSGGPFYYQGRLLGALFGITHTGLSYYNYYTSIPHHLNWILSTIGYRWRGLPAQANTRYTGTILQTLATTERVCQYACDKTSSCEAYNFLTTAPPGTASCNLYGDITGAVTSTGWRGSLKHGARTGNSNDVVGFIRTDNVNSVVHQAIDGNLHELTLDGSSWSSHTINPSATVASKLSAYRRVEGVDALIFRDSTNHVVQLLRTGGNSWTDEADLTDVTNAPLAVGNPMAYVRADGVNAIVYRTAAGHIIELRRGSRGFLKTDLMAASGAPSDVDAASDPVATVRSDGYSSVVFRSTAGQVVELYRAVGGDWHIGSPSGVAGAPVAVDRPFVYTERDGTNAIVYRTDLNRIIKLTLSGSQWTSAQIATNGAGSPVAYTRTDAVTAVMFRNTANKLVQVTGATTDLTTLTGAANAATSPAIYVRNDGFNAVLFETSANHVGELFVQRGGTWGSGDITAVAGETP
jgi:hypothetical protein